MSTQDFFTTVDLDFPDIDIDAFNRTFTHGYEDPDPSKRLGVINFYSLDLDIKESIKQRLPQDLQSWIRNIRVAIIQGQTLMPHIDHGGSVIINFYFVPGNAQTTFYVAKPDAAAMRAPGKYTENIYHFDDVVEQCHFVADVNSCYLLNTGRIHSVTMENSNSVRKILQLTFNPEVNYSQVYEKLNQIGIIKHD